MKPIIPFEHIDKNQQIVERLKKRIEFIEGLSYKEDGHTKRVADLLKEILGEEK